jgi:hypothetical protein
MESEMELTKERLLRPAEASAYLMERFACRQSVGSLARLRHYGTGPRFRKVGSKDVAYSTTALDEWAAARLSPAEFTSTVEAQCAIRPRSVVTA